MLGKKKIYYQQASFLNISTKKLLYIISQSEQMGIAMVMELQFREILGLFFHTVDKYLAPTDYLSFHIFWMMPWIIPKWRNINFLHPKWSTAKRASVTELRQKMEGHFLQ